MKNKNQLFIQSKPSLFVLGSSRTPRIACVVVEHGCSFCQRVNAYLPLAADN